MSNPIQESLSDALGLCVSEKYPISWFLALFGRQNTFF